MDILVSPGYIELPTSHAALLRRVGYSVPCFLFRIAKACHRQGKQTLSDTRDGKQPNRSVYSHYSTRLTTIRIHRACGKSETHATATTQRPIASIAERTINHGTLCVPRLDSSVFFFYWTCTSMTLRSTSVLGTVTRSTPFLSSARTLLLSHSSGSASRMS